MLSKEQLLTEGEEKKIRVPWVREVYHNFRIQEELGVLSGPEAGKELRAFMYADTMAWSLLLTLLVTCTLPALLELHPDNLTEDLWAERCFFVSLLLSFFFNLYAVQGCVTSAIAISACSDLSIGRFLVEKWGPTSSVALDGWWHNFFYQKELCILFMYVSIALRAYCAHGTWALAFAALAGITFHKFMWTSFSLNMAFASRTTKQFLNELEDDFEDLI